MKVCIARAEKVGGGTCSWEGKAAVRRDERRAMRGRLWEMQVKGILRKSKLVERSDVVFLKVKLSEQFKYLICRASKLESAYMAGVSAD